jgi:uncharacterized membrane protein (DUF4010 family)
MATIAAFYLCVRAGYAWLGVIGLLVLSYFSGVARTSDVAEPMNCQRLRQKNSKPLPHFPR